MSWSDRVKEVLTMQEVLEKYLGFPDRLQKWVCPFHNDKHPSLSINKRTDKFKCFACGASGDLIDFVQMNFKCSQKEALQILSNDFGIGLETGKKKSPRRMDKIAQSREFEREAEEELERRCKVQKKSINTALWVARDVLNRNYPRKGEDMEAFMETSRPTRCMWATVQEAYTLWLLDCLDCTPFDECAANFHFDLDVLHRNPLEFARDYGDEERLNWKLHRRKRRVLEMLEKGEIGYIWLYHNITISA